MFLSDLFERDNVKCPIWLTKTIIEDDWADSVYSIEGNIHKWHLKTDFKDVHITFNGDEYHFIAFDRKGDIMFDNVITEEYYIFC